MPAGLHVTTATTNFIHRFEKYTYNGLNDFEHSETTVSFKQAQRHPKLKGLVEKGRKWRSEVEIEIAPI